MWVIFVGLALLFGSVLGATEQNSLAIPLDKLILNQKNVKVSGETIVSLIPESNCIFPWVKFSFPQGTLDCSEYRFISAEIENRSNTQVSATLWVCSTGGWQPVSHTLELAPNHKATFKVDLCLLWRDLKPRIDPRCIKTFQIVFNRPNPNVEVFLSDLKAFGKPSIPFAAPKDRLIVPEMIYDKPSPGKRVKEKLPGYMDTNVYHSLYLPKDWNTGISYPIIIEYSGNEWYSSCYSTGLPEGGNMGFGMSKGVGYIWVGAPCVNKDRNEIQTTWWDEDATADYAIALVRWVCETYGGDSSAVFLTGFSRGGIACTKIGLSNEAISDVWLAFHPCQHYEIGGDAKLKRMPRISGRATFHTDNFKPEILRMFESLNFPVEWANSGLGYHSDVMMLDERPSTVALRNWLLNTLKMRPGTRSVSGTVANSEGIGLASVRVESGTHFTRTNATGNYTLRSLIDGPRRLIITTQRGQMLERQILLAGMDLQQINFVALEE